MKIGDNLICIRNNINMATGEMHHIKGNKYVLIDYDIDTEFSKYHVRGEKAIWKFSETSFHSHFILLKEQRKDKLKKIYESNL